MLVRAIAMLAAALSPIHAPGQSITTRPNSSGEYPPLHQIDLPANAYLVGLALSNDGSRVYVRVPDSAINIAALVLNFWPEWFGALAVLAALALLLAWHRISRTPRLAGEPHCRRCNYCLKNNPTDRCPECGVACVRPIVGRRPARRVLPIAIPAAFVILAYAAAWIAGVPRRSEAAFKWDWWSYELEAVALKRGITLKQFAVRVDAVKEFDTRSGTCLRTLTSDLGVATPWCRMVATPDDKALVVSKHRGTELAIIDRRTGRNITAITVDSLGCSKTSRFDDVVGFDVPSGSIYAVVFDPPCACTALVRWDPNRSKIEHLARTDADETTSRGSRVLWPRRFVCVPGINPTYIVEATASVAVPSNTGETKFRTRKAGTPDTVLAEATHSTWGYSSPLPLADGEHFLIGSRRGLMSGLSRVQTSTYSIVADESVRSYFLDGMRSAGFPCRTLVAVGARHAWQLVARESIAVLDSSNGKKVAIFALPKDALHAQHLQLAAQGGWMVAHVFRKDPAVPNSFIHSVVVYEIPDAARP